jgi:uncharacterized protein
MKTFTLITGANGGLAYEFTLDCARRGHNLLLTDISKKNLDALAEKLHAAYGVDILTFACDLTDLAQRQKLFAYIKDHDIALYMTINIAGLDFEGETVALTSENIATLIRLNVESTFDICRFVSTTNTLDDFYIINTASLAGFYPMPYKASYSASKSAVMLFSLALREEIRNCGGHVTVLCPSGLRTNPIVCQKIDSQGFMGQITTVSTTVVARKTIDKALKNRAKYVPGFINQFLLSLSSIVPKTTKAKIIHKRWTSNLHKSLV